MRLCSAARCSIRSPGGAFRADMDGRRNATNARACVTGWGAVETGPAPANCASACWNSSPDTDSGLGPVTTGRRVATYFFFARGVA